MCGGNGRVRSNQGFFTVQQTCPQCAGGGEEITNPCKDCNGQGNTQASKKLSVTIPKGVDDGTRIRLAGKGEAGMRGSASGDLYLFISISNKLLQSTLLAGCRSCAPHPDFRAPPKPHPSRYGLRPSLH